MPRAGAVRRLPPGAATGRSGTMSETAIKGAYDMTNRLRTPYYVQAYPGELLGKFSSANAAQRVAQWWSEYWGNWTEVVSTRRKGAGIIGQYDNGMPTSEFQGRGDEFYPGGKTRQGWLNVT